MIHKLQCAIHLGPLIFQGAISKTEKQSPKLEHVGNRG